MGALLSPEQQPVRGGCKYPANVTIWAEGGAMAGKCLVEMTVSLEIPTAMMSSRGVRRVGLGGFQRLD